MTSRTQMILMQAILLSVLTGIAPGCGDDGNDGDADVALLTAPSNLTVTTVDGRPRLTWTDGEGEEQYMIQRMDHSAGTDWTVVKDGDSLVANSNQFYDSSAQSGTAYMYRVVAMRDNQKVRSNEVAWP